MNPYLGASSQALVVVDVETSGTSLARHSLLSAAFVPIEARLPPLVTYFRPHSIKWAPLARQMFEGYREVWEREAVSPRRACEEITEYLHRSFSKPATIIAHNVAFDFAFLRKAFHQAGAREAVAFSHRAVDTHSLLFLAHAKGLIPASALSSSGAFAYFGIDVPGDARHTALGDAIATRQLFLRLLQVL